MSYAERMQKESEKQIHKIEQLEREVRSLKGILKEVKMPLFKYDYDKVKQAEKLISEAHESLCR